METFPVLGTKRLILNQLSLMDVDRVVECVSVPEIAEFTLNIPHPYTRDHAITWIESSHEAFKLRSAYIFALRDKVSRQVLGAMGVHVNKTHQRAEIGYWVAKPLWNKGYASEALKEIIRFGMEDLKLNKLYATYAVKNPASGRVMEKSGMNYEGIMKQHIFRDGVFHDIKQYCITQDEYEKQKG